MKPVFTNIPKKLRRRTWYSDGGAYAFLVDAPITVGHSQLVILFKPRQKEEEVFKRASLHIAKCIEILRRTLDELSRKNFMAWGKFARYTETSGKYKKTLILRASASEKAGEYKIHLVPYFKSHFDATKRLFTATQNRKPATAGGLLNWVGQRERLVDYDVRYGRNDKAVKSRISSFKLPRLASMLHSRAVKKERLRLTPRSYNGE